MASHEALIHCSCTVPFSASRPPPSDPPLALFQHHSLSDLLFCEDCDAVRCNSASVRGEKNRCARNCFQCPQCDHTLSVVASDPDPSTPLNSAAASVGEPPYFLTCTFCRWDSKEVGIEFEKPTALALQLQKAEEPTADLLEFDHLKDHLEPYLRRSQAHATSTARAPGASSSSAVLSAISAQLFKDVPGLVTRYGGNGSLFGTNSRARGGGGGGGGGGDSGQAADELAQYSSLYPSRGGGPGSEKENRRTRTASKGKAADRDAELVARMREMMDFEETACLDRRWTAGWQPPVFSSELRPLRTPLQAKLSKRCPACMHILIKPEQKSSSTRYKIKLVAANYLPSILIQRQLPASIGSRLSAIAAGTASGLRRTARTSAGRDDGSGAGDEEPLRPGRTYTFDLSFTNPLYEPIHVRLAVARPGANKPIEEGQQAPPPPFAVNLPSPTFPIAAYAEDWEYEDEEDGEVAGGADGGDGRASPTKRKGKGGPGIVERKMNRTTISMDVAIAKDVVGSLRANMLVTYVYQADDAVPPSPNKSPQKGGSKAQDVKTFSFWTLVPLGTVVPRPATEPRRSMAVSSGSAA
ncbi:dynactin 4 [Rhodotorula toruloides]|uniref:Dynactin subunit 4 n=1 Tax=Rhodotorula toruloides TaxID=5286 RepID=A0A511KAK8_RHOTO|nr:dynactin 4 [Rhodotorula toruloides]